MNYDFINDISRTSLSYYLGKMNNPRKAELIAQALQPNFMYDYTECFKVVIASNSNTE